MNNKIYREKTIIRVENKINYLNLKIKPRTFLNSRIFICLLTFIILLLSFDLGIVIAPIISLIIYFSYEFILLDIPVSKKRKAIDEEVYEFFSMIVLALKNNMNLISAIELVSTKSNYILSKSFRRVAKEVSFGKALTDALNDIKKKIPNDNANNLISILINSYRDINYLISSLEVELKQVNDTIINDKKCLINKIPAKVNIVTLLFVIGIVSLVLYTLNDLKIISLIK